MTDAKLKRLTKAIMKEQDSRTNTYFLAMELYNTALSSPSFNKCLQIVRSVKKTFGGKNVKARSKRSSN